MVQELSKEQTSFGDFVSEQHLEKNALQLWQTKPP